MNSDITIHPDNETYVLIDCDESITQDLVDFFSFSVPVWLPRKSNGGKTRYPKMTTVKIFQKRKKQLYRGLIPYVVQFAEDNNYTISYSDSSLEYNADVSYFEIEKYVKTLNLHSKGKPIEARDYQLKGIVRSLRDRRILLLSPTGSGKSLIAYILIRIISTVLRQKKQRILIIVPSINLVEQLYKDFLDYSSENKWNVEKNVHRIHAEYEKLEKLYIIQLANNKTLKLRGSEYIMLLNNKKKKVSELTEQDEISDDYLLNLQSN